MPSLPRQARAQDEDDDLAAQLCESCLGRPEGKRLLNVPPPSLANDGARAFTEADCSMIEKVRGNLSAQKLLDILNDRLMADLGPDAAPYTLEQLHRHMGASTVVKGGDLDWRSVRRLIARARLDGVLNVINEQVITDFAVVYSLNPKQMLALKDIVLQAKDQS